MVKVKFRMISYAFSYEEAWPVSPISSELVYDRLREDGVEVESFDERLAAAHTDLFEDVLDVFLDGVLGDVEGLLGLPGRGAAHHEPDHLLFAGAQGVGGSVKPRRLFKPGRLDDDH